MNLMFREACTHALALSILFDSKMREAKINGSVQPHAYFIALFVNSNSREIIDGTPPEDRKDVCFFCS